MENRQELAVNVGRFVAERDEIQIEDITEETVEEVVREFIRQVLKGRELSEEELALVHVAVEEGLFDGATVNEMEG